MSNPYLFCKEELERKMENLVKVIEVSTILPATYQATTVPKRIDLTPWDLQFLLISPMKYGLVFSSKLEPELLERLKKSLSRTLDFFYPLAGCLRSIEDVSKDSTLFYIECNNVGVEFTHAATDLITIDDVLQRVYDFELMNLLCTGKLETECGAKRRFLSVQATDLANGGFFLSCSMSHAFGDGSSFWHFFNSWSEICRGCDDSLKNPPLLERCYPGQAEIWIPNQLIAPLQPSDKNDQLSQQPAFKEKIFIFPKEKLALLKQKAIEQTGNQKISSLQALLAFAWTLTSRYRQIQDENIIIFAMLIGVRTRLQPSLTEYYLGNAIHGASTTMKAKDLRDDDGFGHAASKVHDMVASQSETAVKNFLTSWVEKPVIKKSNGKKPTNIALLRSSPRFKVYGNDFGWGRPVAVRRGAMNEIEGMITLFEGPENGSVHIELCLLPQTLELVEKDTEFLNYVC